MIDLKITAEERAAQKELAKRTIEAYAKDVTIEVLTGRVLLLPIMDEDEMGEKESVLILDENFKKELKSNTLRRAIVKSVSGNIQHLSKNDIVYVYPNQFEATISLNGVGYLIYQDRCIIAKDILPFVESNNNIVNSVIAEA